jgi:Protein of unknown function (DUF3987)
VPPRCHPDWIKAFVDLYDFIEPTNKLLFWSAVSAVAGAVQHNVIVDQISYKLPLNHYIILVGNPGTRKTTASMQAQSLLMSIRNALNIKFASQAASWQAIVDDLAENSCIDYLWDPSGGLKHTYLNAMLSEFGSLFKADDAGMVDFLVDLWDLQAVWKKKARKDGEAIELERPSINLLSCTTQSWIEDNFRRSLAKGGLGSRIIWVHETRIKRLVPFVDEATPSDYRAKVQNLQRDLVHIGSLKGVITYTHEAREYMREWYKSANKALLERDTDDIESGFVSRKQAHALKLSAIFSLSRRDTLEVTLEDITLACKLIDDVIPDIQLIFKSLNTTKISEHVMWIEDKIEAMGVRASEGRVFHAMGRRIPNRRLFDEALDTLSLQGSIYMEGDRPNRLLTHTNNLTPLQWQGAQYTNCRYARKIGI